MDLTEVCVMHTTRSISVYSRNWRRSVALYKFNILTWLEWTVFITKQQWSDIGQTEAGQCVHFVSPGLLQLTVLRHHRRGSDEPAAVWCRALDGTTTSRRCCTDFRFDVGWTVDFKMGWPTTTDLQHGSDWCFAVAVLYSCSCSPHPFSWSATGWH